MSYLTLEQGTRLALDRKRRMRLIYKWRHGLDRTHQPQHRDRGKLRFLAHFDYMKLDELAERIIAPMTAYWERQLHL